MTASWYHWRDGRLRLVVTVQPGASRTAVVGVHGDALKIKLAAPAVDGRANTALIEFLGRSFGVAPSRVALLQGNRGRRKMLELAPAAEDSQPLLARWERLP